MSKTDELIQSAKKALAEFELRVTIYINSWKGDVHVTN